MRGITIKRTIAHPEASQTWIRLVFSQFDSDGDGQISLGELREAMKKLMGEQLNHREIDEILRDVDLNGDGQVDFEGERFARAGPEHAGIRRHSCALSSCRVCADDVSLRPPRWSSAGHQRGADTVSVRPDPPCVKIHVGFWFS